MDVQTFTVHIFICVYYVLRIRLLHQPNRAMWTVIIFYHTYFSAADATLLEIESILMNEYQNN